MARAAHEHVRAVARRFQLPGDFLDVAPCGDGHINDTYAVRFDQAGVGVRYVLQRLNPAVFGDPAGLMDNVVRVTRHLRRKLEEAGAAEVSRRVLTLLPTRAGQPYHRDAEGTVWRAYLFVEQTVTHAVLASPQQAEAVAHAFGAFQAMLLDLPGLRLVEVIPGFHDARRRFEALQRAVAADVCNRAAEVKRELAFVQDREALLDVLADLHARGDLPERITHNDTKVSNLLFDARTGRALCVIDLDTVMPGLALFDFGDMVRTAASTAPEDAQDLGAMALSRPHFEALARGYWQATRGFLTPCEKEHLVFSGKWMTLVMGIRFLTDYLLGDTYYKVYRGGHNLDRCRAQFKLVESIEAQEAALNRFVEQL